jgi:hypothetical protein
MEIKLRYNWGADNVSEDVLEAVESEMMNIASVKGDIAIMLAKGFDVKAMKSKIRTLDSLNDRVR